MDKNTDIECYLKIIQKDITDKYSDISFKYVINAKNITIMLSCEKVNSLVQTTHILISYGFKRNTTLGDIFFSNKNICIYVKEIVDVLNDIRIKGLKELL